ncbi:MAG: hypothetical protein AB7U46_04770 [Paenirhodobacter sp.]|uniref:hypothetical protein n=1 Tax=Paenirhodobacter sp. TaxID=1965326 RepID=UPI003D1137DA
MWILVMFDLSTDTKPQRKAAGDFRNFLLDEGSSAASSRSTHGSSTARKHLQAGSAGSNAPCRTGAPAGAGGSVTTRAVLMRDAHFNSRHPAVKRFENKWMWRSVV